MIDRSKMLRILRGYYPNSAKFTRPLIDEMVEKMDAAGVDDEMFVVLVKKYRNDFARLVDNSFNFAPDPRQLLLYHHKTYAENQSSERRPIMPRFTFREWRTRQGFTTLGDYLESLYGHRKPKPEKADDIETIDGVDVDWSEL